MRWNAWLGWLAVGTLAAMAACVLSSPPPDVPLPTPRRPMIIDTSASPPLDQPVTSVATSPKFQAGVEAERDRGLYCSVFVDYDGTNLQVPPPVTFCAATPPAAGSDTLPIVEFTLDDGQITSGFGGPEQCHTITLFVGYNLVGGLPQLNEGDNVTWQYRPGGEYAACPTFEGGAPDAGVGDAADGGAE